ncbi:MAG: LCP family protein [Anaerolineales bacterium]|nr:LCP family protein [Anaerolineales bacterium]
MFKIVKRLAWIWLVLATVGCSVPMLAVGSQAEDDALDPLLLAIAPPGSTPTATPFLPIAPTPTYLPTEYPTPTVVILPPTATPPPPMEVEIIAGEQRSWSDYPGPTVWPDIQVPAPTGILAQPAGQVNILLLGSDQRPYEGGLRTDTIVLLTLNLAEGTAHMTSFPRDLYVYIPGWTVNRINTAYAYGGFESLAVTMEYNFGVHPDHYVLINMKVFEKAIDSLGGIMVHVGRDLCDQRDGFGQYCVSQGDRAMNGKTALWYVRARYSTSDFDRGRRQQEIIQAGFERLMSLDGISRAPELFEIYQENVTTDIVFEDITPLIPLAMQIYDDTSRIERYYIGRQQVYDWVNYSGAQVLVPLRDAVLEVMRAALNSE